MMKLYQTDLNINFTFNFYDLTFLLMYKIVFFYLYFTLIPPKVIALEIQ